MAKKPDLPAISIKVAEIATATDRVSANAPRALEEMGEFVYPGAREIATLTMVARSHDWEFEHVMKALRVLEKLDDWSHAFMVAHNLKTTSKISGPRFNWRDAPYRQYASFREFYEQELEETFGDWEKLKALAVEVANRTKTPAQAKASVQAALARANQPSQQGKRTDLAPAPAPAETVAIDADGQGNFVYTKENDVNEVGRPWGNSAAAAIRRLRKDRPDILARVLAGEIAPNAGMIEAGFRKKRPSKRLDAAQQIERLLKKLGPGAQEDYCTRYCTKRIK